ncbi:MAG: transcription-repair coupling factor [Bacteroidales bacterium]|nr:transcription-repair coupling factor [Bacteroidales bacterium]
MILTELYTDSQLVASLANSLATPRARLHIDGMTGSLPAVAAATLHLRNTLGCQMFIMPTKEEAFYMLNDIESLLDEVELEADQKQALLFPTTYRRNERRDPDETDNANVLMRAAVVRQLSAGRRLIVVTYPEALAETVVSKRTLTSKTLQIAQDAKLDMDFVIDVLQDYDFERVDFVVEPGQYSVRGGIIDVFSFANEHPFRIEFFDDSVESLRTFDTATQLSIRRMDQISILPDLDRRNTVTVEQTVSLLNYFGSNDIIFTPSLTLAAEAMEKASGSATEFLKLALECRIAEYGNSHFFSNAQNVKTESEPQPTFNKQFDLLVATLDRYAEQGYTMIITAANESQERRLHKILNRPDAATIKLFSFQLSHGFVDHQARLLCFTDHEIFERYHKYTVRDLSQGREAMTLKELFELKPGDYVTHIDYGVGRFSGLEKITTNGHTQEVIRLIYKNNDTLYISIHGLHKISRYVGKEGAAPTLNRLGSNTWQVLKQKTKRQVKDIAKDLITLYAKRKASHGFAFSPDSYLQEQLEASFAYEDTPDQLKASRAVKHDMELSAPMDRLVCGDVGFGKTEVAIRAAFKSCCDSKQVAVLVPSTILAFQHYNTFCQRLHDMPVRIDYLNRFRTTREKNQIYKDLSEGKIDILIGTHAITNKNLKFKDLGLLIIDEEQKFGVAVKERLKEMKANVDCLTLTATPIPRTLQFSLMGARDMSIIQTPPPNRQPIQTELLPFDEETIRDAIMFEMSRSGQTFFISNRVENLPEMAGLVQRLVPDARVAIAHGQMDGKKVEETMMQFLEGEIDVLVATSIIENGLDIPNANTMIINSAQNFGLSDLHQMRGRVGRSNRKAFCYLLVPSFTVLTPEAQKRLKAIEEFSNIGSGFNIAMRDLDIRGAGNILGAEQSGFISEIGYDMYHKILNEAIEELKETDFKELFAAESEEKKEYVRECNIETDLEVLLPDDYVTSVSERLLLYHELNSLSTDDELEAYAQRLADRFGPLPQATRELISTITLRRMAKEFGIEKIVLKQDRLVCHFAAGQDNPFYRSANFMKMIQYVQQHPTQAKLKETPERLTLSCANVSTIKQAIERMQALTA